EGKEQRPCLPRPPQCEDVTEWGEWTKCESECGQGQQRRKRQCLADECDGKTEEKRPCWIPGKMACWLEWSEWTQCSQTCDGGHRKRQRVCPLSGECEGAAFEVAQCNTERCSTGVWGDWLPCSVSCGIGFQIRERLCEGVLCETANKQARTCNEQPCPENSDGFVWEEWSEWSECSQTCGEGFQSKERKCKRGLPVCSYRSTGPILQSTDQASPCPNLEDNVQRVVASVGLVPRGMSGPSGQNVLLVPMFTAGQGQGSASRTQAKAMRHVKVVAHGGRIVPITDETWGNWMEWTECSQSCGTGKRRRSRVCIGHNCPPQPLESVKEKCNEQPCPPGTTPSYLKASRLLLPSRISESLWSSWTAWTTCSVTCGDNGIQSRRRTCLRSSFFQCEGQPIQTRSCSAQISCVPSQAIHPVSVPTWSEWSSWSSCSCFTLMESRRRFCLVSDPAVQGFCTGAILDQRPCAARSCAASPGGWSGWSEWSSCSKDCQGTGHQIRNRMCSEPLPSNRCFFMYTLADKRAEAAMRMCAGVINKAPGHSGNSTSPLPTTNHSLCSYLIFNRVFRARLHFRGSYCVGYSFDQRPCTSSTPCGVRVDGGWSDWSEWSDCGDSCVNAHRSRTRYCSKPRPSQGGRPCFGSDFELQPCVNQAKCRNSVNGAWGMWSAWSECPDGCGFAIQSRHRACNNPAPSSGGEACHGLAHQTSVCGTESCNGSHILRSLPHLHSVRGVYLFIESTDGEWSAWNEWSACVGNCGLGSRTRVRACVSPPPTDGGVPCFGKSSESEECQAESAFCSRFLHHADILDVRLLQSIQ
ncbi:thrombospondin type 1 domain protein, partial [Ostertagia ostertagi]